MKFLMVYEDGGLWEGEPHLSPEYDCIGILQPEAPAPERELLNGDYYLYRTDLERWTECGHSGLERHLVRFAHVISAVRPGFWMPEREAWRDLMQAGRDRLNA
jgi:hypothetical protein